MSKNLLRLLLVVIFMVGCGGIKENIAPSETPNVQNVAAENQVEIKGVRKVAIFPFADYSHQQDFIKEDIWGGNIRILEEVTDHFVAHGISVIVQEDVNTLLVNNDIIHPIANQYLIYGSEGDDKAELRTKVLGTPEYDLVNVQHSEDMKDEIRRIITSEMALEEAERPPIQTPILQGATVGLSRGKIMELGELLGVDLIIRGRIIEYGFKRVNTYNPLKRGFLPVLIEPMRDMLVGAADQKTYESGLGSVDYKEWESRNDFILDRKREEEDVSRIGEVFGFFFGQKTQDDVEGTWDATMEYSIGTLGELYPRKKSMSSIVQIRMFAQDARTGDILWSNRAETEYVPPTGVSFNSKHPKTMFDVNIKRCVKLLMDDLFACVSLAAQKNIALQESSIALNDLEERLSENKVLVEELQGKIGNLENSKKILLQQTKGKTFITLPDAVLFPSGYSTITPQGIKTLKTISGVLERYPNHDICIEGHTDTVPIGSKIKDKYATNWELSTARAIQVKNYMVKNSKIDQRQVAVKGYGPYKPVASNATSEGKSENRRVVIVVGPRI